MGMRRVRLANLPPEVPDRVLRDMLTKYGEVKDISGELWSRAYWYPASKGIRMVELSLKQHIPSRLLIEGNRALISYEGHRL